MLRTTRNCTAILLALACAASIASAGGDISAEAREGFPTAGVCEREGVKLVGKKPVRVGGKIRAPKKVRNVSPKFPTLPAGTTGSGVWMGEAMIDTKGKVSGVWALREVKLTPPFPEFNDSIVDAIRQWEFEPPRLNNMATPMCMAVTVSINWA